MTNGLFRYGWQTLLFGWIDTLQENYPEPLSPMLFASVFQLMEHLRPDLAKLFFLDSLNQSMYLLFIYYCYRFHIPYVKRAVIILRSKFF